jgi:hypothetical protein
LIFFSAENTADMNINLNLLQSRHDEIVFRREPVMFRSSRELSLLFSLEVYLLLLRHDLLLLSGSIATSCY